MATLLTQQCDRCPTTVQWDPTKTKQYRYVVDESSVDEADAKSLVRESALRGAALDQPRSTRTIILPADWGVLELNVGHEKQVQEICPACVVQIRSFVNDTEHQLNSKGEESERLLADETP